MFRNCVRRPEGALAPPRATLRPSRRESLAHSSRPSVGATRCWSFLLVAALAALAASSAADAAPWFVDVSGSVGFDFVHESGAVGSLEMPEIMGPGCAIFDADQDGDLDLYLLQGSFAYSDPGHAPAPTNVLFLRGADGRYSRAKKSGLEDPGYGMGVAIGDVNGDDLVDVYVTNAGPDRLFLNLGGGKFRDASSEWGVGDPAWGCSVAMFDLEGDGGLDVFVSHYVK